MTPSQQLAKIEKDLYAASSRAKRLQEKASMKSLLATPAKGGWSAAQCVEHLNLTTRAFLPIFETALDNASVHPKKVKGRYHMNLTGWLLAMMLGIRFVKTKTAKNFEPATLLDAGTTLSEFQRLQSAILPFLRRSTGLAIDKINIRSPFNSKLQYSVYSALRIIIVHENRHLAQAESAAGISS